MPSNSDSATKSFTQFGHARAALVVDGPVLEGIFRAKAYAMAARAKEKGNDTPAGDWGDCGDVDDVDGGSGDAEVGAEDDSNRFFIAEGSMGQQRKGRVWCLPAGSL